MVEPTPHTIAEISDATASISSDGQTVTVVLTIRAGNHPLWYEMPAEVAERLASQLPHGTSRQQPPSEHP
jgi:hypothetical protein